MIPTSTSFSTRSSDTNITSTSSVMKQQPILNGQQTMPVPVLRTQQQISSGRLSTLSTQEKTSFKPVIIQQQPPPNISENIVRPSSIHPQNNSHYSGTEGHPFVSFKPIQSHSRQIEMIFLFSLVHFMVHVHHNWINRLHLSALLQRIKRSLIINHGNNNNNNNLVYNF
jgi:hypothetical protein